MYHNMRILYHLRLVKGLLLFFVAQSAIALPSNLPSLRKRNITNDDVFIDKNTLESKKDKISSRNLSSFLDFFGETLRHPRPRLHRCQGDCDSNEDCDVGLKCFQTDGGIPIPGCAVDYSGRTDFCIIDDGSTTHSVQESTLLSFGWNPSIHVKPLQICQGDCDKDEDCKTGLICFQRGTGKKRGQKVPGCIGVDYSSTDYCVQPELVRFGRNPEFLLRICEGDCDTDADCDDGLFCFQKDKNQEVQVPGCTGVDNSRTDYCISERFRPSFPPSRFPTKSYTMPQFQNGGSKTDEPSKLPTASPIDNTLLTTPFQLKLYWEEGYDWQGQYTERKWCGMYQYGGNKRTGKCWYGPDHGICQPDEVYLSKCQNDDYRQKFRFEPIVGNNHNDEVHIISSGGIGAYSELCLQSKYGTAIFLGICNSDNLSQRWYAIRGSFDSDKFEISQRNTALTKDHCLTTRHHPKDGEVFELMTCKVARSSEHLSSWWEKY